MNISASKTGLCIKNVTKTFGHLTALSDTSIDIRPGEFFTLLGPSGCGKTTLLRIIAGLELADSGQVLLGGTDISGLPANKRQVNIVFQSYALFPHLTVFENVAFGLRSRKVDRKEILERVEQGLSMVDLSDFADRYTHQMSGGQQQRVALARALVNRPEVLLLDEPMSALDARLRAQVQVELKRLHQKLGQTFILVTHDQAEALVVSERIAVMNEGRIIQSGTPEEVYDSPNCAFVANFLGAANLISASCVNGGAQTAVGKLQLAGTPPWETGTLSIRPERIRICSEPPALNGVKAKIVETIYQGNSVELLLEPGPLRVRAKPDRQLTPGDEIWLELPPERLVILDD
jgi:spermidine/putrescine transport system ATP-binding protein